MRFGFNGLFSVLVVGWLDEDRASVPSWSAGPILFGSLSGELSRRCSIDRTAASSSSSLISPTGEDSSSEFWVDSGGEITAPGGMAALVNGGGD